MNKQERVRFGLLGTGEIIREFCLPAPLNNPKAEVTVLGNQRARSLRRLGEKY